MYELHLELMSIWCIVINCITILLIYRETMSDEQVNPRPNKVGNKPMKEIE